MKKEKYKIGVAGLGMVGDQVKRWFEGKRFQVFAYDKFKGDGKFGDLKNADVIFLCLPTAHNKKKKGGVDLSLFEYYAKNLGDKKIFVIKSTVPPGTTEYLQKEFPNHYFLHSPEFLTEATAWKDFSKPVFQILGYTEKSKKVVNKILSILPKGRANKAMKSSESEIFKFARNAFFAVKVIFANHIYDITQKYGGDYDVLKKLMLTDPWIGGHHLEAVHKGYRGYGGKCLPKDLKTFIKIFEESGLNPELFKSADKVNEGLLKKQKLIKTLNKYWLNNENMRNNE